MSDVFDDATATEEAYREQAIARQLEASKGPDVRNVHCSDCGEEIDPQRRAVVRNCRRCIGCERVSAARMKLRGR